MRRKERRIVPPLSFTRHTSSPFPTQIGIYTDSIAICCCWYACRGTNRGTGMYACIQRKETPCHLSVSPCYLPLPSLALPLSLSCERARAHALFRCSSLLSLSFAPYGPTAVGGDELSIATKERKMISDHHPAAHDALLLLLSIFFFCRFSRNLFLHCAANQESLFLPLQVQSRR